MHRNKLIILKRKPGMLLVGLLSLWIFSFLLASFWIPRLFINDSEKTWILVNTMTTVPFLLLFAASVISRYWLLFYSSVDIDLFRTTYVVSCFMLITSSFHFVSTPTVINTSSALRDHDSWISIINHKVKLQIRIVYHSSKPVELVFNVFKSDILYLSEQTERGGRLVSKTPRRLWIKYAPDRKEIIPDMFYLILHKNTPGMLQTWRCSLSDL